MNSKIVSEPTGEQMTLFSLVGSLNPANHTALQEKDLEKKMTVTSGLTVLKQLGSLNQITAFSKMFSELLIGTGDWYSTRCMLTWKLKGTKYKRLYFQLQVSAHRTGETGFGLLPTPRSTKISGTDREDFTPSLPGLMNKGMLPTPTQRDFKTGSKEERPKGQPSRRSELNHLMAMVQETGQTSLQLNPQFVGEMMGYPRGWTLSPFLSGETKASKHTETP